MRSGANIYTVLGGLLVAALIAWSLQLSPVLTAIGANILRTSSSIALGHGWIGSEVDPFGERAPLMGTIVGLLGLVGLSPMNALRYAACAGYVLAVGGTGIFLRTIQVRPPILVLGGAVLAPLALLLRASAGELYLIGCTMIALAAVARHLAMPTRRWLIIAAGAASIAGLSHYIAVLVLFPIIVGAAAIQRRPWHIRLRDVLVTSALTAAPISIWLVRNQLLTGHMTGMSRLDVRLQVMVMSPWEHTVGLGRTLLFDLAGVSTMGTQSAVYLGIPPFEMGLTVALASTIAGLAIIAILASLGGIRRWLAEQRARPSAAAWAWAVALTYVTLYITVIIVVWSVANNDRIQTRFLVALYPAVLACFAGLPALLGNSTPRRWPPKLAFVALLLLLGVQGYKASLVLVDNPNEEVVPDQWTVRRKTSDWTWERWAIRHKAAEQYKLRTKVREAPAED